MTRDNSDCDSYWLAEKWVTALIGGKLSEIFVGNTNVGAEAVVTIVNGFKSKASLNFFNFQKIPFELLFPTVQNFLYFFHCIFYTQLPKKGFFLDTCLFANLFITSYHPNG